MLWRWSHKKSEEENTKESEERADTEARGRIGGLRDLPLNSATRSNYSVSSQRKPLYVAEGRRTQTGLVASAGAACAFFLGRPCWRAPFSLMQLRVGLTDVPRGKVSGRAMWESGLRDVRRRR